MSRLLSFLLFILIFAAADVALEAQETRAELLLQAREAKAKELEPHTPGGLEKYLVKIESERFLERLFRGSDKGFYPKFGTLASGSALALGPGYRDRTLFGGQAHLDAFSAYSIETYWLSEASLRMPTLAEGKVFADVRVRHERFPGMDFFGIGPDSLRSDRSKFGLFNTIVGGTVGRRVTPIVSLGGGFEYIAPDVRSAHRNGFPSFDEIFTPDEVPGMLVQPDFLHSQVFGEINTRVPRENPRSGSLVRSSYHFFNDRGLDRFSYRRLDGEVQQYFPFLNQRRVIALRGLISTSFHDDDEEVPFYLMPTLGGSRTLRGFRSYRFRDEHYLLLQAEYRWEIYPALDVALFYDTGKVASRQSDLDLKHAESDYGIAFRFGTNNGVFLRIEAAFGSQDGPHFRVRFNDVF